MGFIILQIVMLLAVSGLLFFIWRADMRAMQSHEDEGRVLQPVRAQRRDRR